MFHVVRERSCAETSIFCSTKILDSQTTADSSFNFTNSIEIQTVMGKGARCMCKTGGEVTYLEVMRVFWLMEFEISGEDNVQRTKDKKMIDEEMMEGSVTFRGTRISPSSRT